MKFTIFITLIVSIISCTSKYEKPKEETTLPIQKTLITSERLEEPKPEKPSLNVLLTITTN